jgi:hypothetical protein
MFRIPPTARSEGIGRSFDLWHDPPRFELPQQGGGMAVYMVERDLPGITGEQLAGAQGAAIAGSQKSTDGGTPVRYIRSTFVPAESKCMCLFEADTADAVRDVNTAAGLPFNRIVEAMDLTPR